MPPIRPAQLYRTIIWIVIASFVVTARVLTAAFPGVFTVLLIPITLVRATATWLQWREVRIDQHGVRRRSALVATPWSRVESILQPNTAMSGLRLRTTDGKVLPTGIPVEHAQALSEIGGRALLRDD